MRNTVGCSPARNGRRIIPGFRNGRSHAGASSNVTNCTNEFCGFCAAALARRILSTATYSGFAVGKSEGRLGTIPRNSDNQREQLDRSESLLSDSFAWRTKCWEIQFGVLFLT